MAGFPLTASVHGVLVFVFGWLVLRWYFRPPGPSSVHAYKEGVTGVQPVGQVGTVATKLTIAEPGTHPVTIGLDSVMLGQHDGQGSIVTVTDTGGQLGGRKACNLAVCVTEPEVFAG